MLITIHINWGIPYWQGSSLCITNTAMLQGNSLLVELQFMYHPYSYAIGEFLTGRALVYVSHHYSHVAGEFLTGRAVVYVSPLQPCSRGIPYWQSCSLCITTTAMLQGNSLVELVHETTIIIIIIIIIILAFKQIINTN